MYVQSKLLYFFLGINIFLSLCTFCINNFAIINNTIISISFFLGNILQGITRNYRESAEYMLKLLQDALHPQFISLIGHNSVSCLRLWQLPVMFANLHQLCLPEKLLLHLAHENNWQLFVTVICLFHYPKWQVGIIF